MDKDNILNFYENEIDKLNKEIKVKKRHKKLLNRRLNNTINIYNFIEKLSNRFFQTMIVLCITIIVYISYEDIYLTSLISLLVLLITNIIKTIFLTIYKPDGLKYNELQEYTNGINDLIVRRSIYISIYSYLKYGEKYLIYNLKQKINNKKYFNFYKFINEEFIKNDDKSVNILIEMKRKERILSESIKNRVYLELKYPTKTEELTNEQLLIIQSSL